MTFLTVKVRLVLKRVPTGKTMFKSDSKPSKARSPQELLAFADSLKQENNDLEKKFEALWSLLKDKFDFSDKDLESYLQKPPPQQPQIDSEEGTKESALNQSLCSKCGRKLSVKTGFCVYCGADPDTVEKALKTFGS